MSCIGDTCAIASNIQKQSPLRGQYKLSLWLSNVVAAGEIYFYDSFVIEITLGSIAHVVLLLCVQCFCV